MSTLPITVSGSVLSDVVDANKTFVILSKVVYDRSAINQPSECAERVFIPWVGHRRPRQYDDS